MEVYLIAYWLKEKQELIKMHSMTFYWSRACQQRLLLSRFPLQLELFHAHLVAFEV